MQIKIPTSEQSKCASWACDPVFTAGRLYKEEESNTRSCFRRDCDRIIHSVAFRRLEYKTQVFINHEGDHYRTRLTHSLEVAQITRSICRNLAINEDLGEALALAHDLGHTPFGHAGEEALNEVTEEFGGFSHNAQTIRILTYLEHKYAEFDGLNLTWETLEGIAKHNGPIIGKNRDKTRYKDGLIPDDIANYNKLKDLQLDSFASAEAQIASLADDIAYNNHDIDDGLRARLFSINDLKSLPFVGDILAEVEKKYPGIAGDRLVHETIRRMINSMVVDLTDTTLKNIMNNKIESVDEIRNLGRPVVAFSSKMQEQQRQIKAFLWNNMYRHYKVCRMTSKAKIIVKELFEKLFNSPENLPTDWQSEEIFYDEEKRVQRVKDFIAGMTDRFAIKEHQRLFNISYRP